MIDERLNPSALPHPTKRPSRAPVRARAPSGFAQAATGFPACAPSRRPSAALRPPAPPHWSRPSSSSVTAMVMIFLRMLPPHLPRLNRVKRQQPPFAALFLHEQASLRIQRRNQHVLCPAQRRDPAKSAAATPAKLPQCACSVPASARRESASAESCHKPAADASPARRGSFIRRWKYAQRAVRLQDNAPGLAQADNAAALHSSIKSERSKQSLASSFFADFCCRAPARSRPAADDPAHPHARI